MPKNSTPTAITVDDFWATIDAAWAKVDSRVQRGLSSPNARTRNAAGNKTFILMDDMRQHLETALEAYTLPQLRAWDDHFHAASEHLSEYTVIEGDDAWTDARAFIIGAGKVYYDRFKKDPARYEIDMGMFEDMGYVAIRVAEKKWGSWEALRDDSGSKLVARRRRTSEVSTAVYELSLIQPANSKSKVKMSISNPLRIRQVSVHMYSSRIAKKREAELVVFS